MAKLDEMVLVRHKRNHLENNMVKIVAERLEKRGEVKILGPAVDFKKKALQESEENEKAEARAKASGVKA